MRRHDSDIESSSVVQKVRGQYGGLWFDGDTPTPEHPGTGNAAPTPGKHLGWSEWWKQNMLYVLNNQRRNQFLPTLGSYFSEYFKFEEKVFFKLAHEYDVTP